MTRMNVILFLMMGVLVFMPFAGGCGGNAQKTAPRMGFGSVDVQTQLSRGDIVVLERVEGTSTTKSILFGAVQVVDGDNVKVLGVPFFKDRYTCLRTDPCLVTTADRAYYKALEATPQADAVFYKSVDREGSGIPLLWETETVTFSGKAITLKTDQP